MFPYILLSITIVPILLGMSAARGRDGGRERSALRVGWVSYAVVWFAILYYLWHRWT